MPLFFRPAAWPMFVGLFVGCIGWSPYVWVRGQGAKHAVAAGIGNGETATVCAQRRHGRCVLTADMAECFAGEYSAMNGNLRSLMATVTPLVYGGIYNWSTSNGRSIPGLAYALSGLFDVAAELTFRSMTKEEIEFPPEEDDA